MAGSEDGGTRAVGPYLLQRTLGKGQTGGLVAALGERERESLLYTQYTQYIILYLYCTCVCV